MHNRLILSIFLLFIVNSVFAQELICDVTVVAPDATKIQIDQKVFKTLEQSVSEFMNNRKWTTDRFGEDEKIECSVFIGVLDNVRDGNDNPIENFYSATITVISKRPVYNSDYKTTVLNVIDNDFNFFYQEFQPIEYNENTFTSNLSHTLAFYAYLIIGTDYETFSEKGGDNYLQKALELTNIISPSEAGQFKGWKAYDKNQRNRYWIITHTLNGRYEPYRLGMYKYYRLGLDNFYTDPVLARQNILEGLADIAKVTQDNPNLPIIQMWSEAKSDEMIKIFADAPQEEKATAIEALKLVDPINGDKYNAITKK